MIRLPGSHMPNIKNRSSKHLGWLTKMKPAVRSLSNAALNELTTAAANKEKARRQKKRAKKEAKNNG